MTHLQLDIVDELRNEAIFDPVRQKAADEIISLRKRVGELGGTNSFKRDDFKKRAEAVLSHLYLGMDTRDLIKDLLNAIDTGEKKDAENG